MGLLTPKVYNTGFALLSLHSLVRQSLPKGDSSCLLSDANSRKKSLLQTV